jgi:hypothetical protein
MYPPRSFLWIFVLLSLPFSDARVANQHAKRADEDGQGLNLLAKRQQYPPSACVNDVYEQWLQTNTIGPQFCADLMSSPTITNTIYLTPTVYVIIGLVSTFFY